MKTAFTYWEKRIAPVFDIARQIRVVESEAGRIIGETHEILADGPVVRKVLNLARLDVATLVCGAISRPLHEMIMSNGIQVIPFVAGDLGEVVRAWLDGKLDNDSFAMPGCCGRGRENQRGPRCESREENRMNQGNGGGPGRGRSGSPLGGDGTGFCICTKCGHRETHQCGLPCIQRRCPKCGTALTRE